jgi:hypothetical protein
MGLPDYNYKVSDLEVGGVLGFDLMHNMLRPVCLQDRPVTGGFADFILGFAGI